MSILLKIATQMSTPTPRRPLVCRHTPYTEDQYEDQASSQPHVQAFSPQCLSLEVLMWDKTDHMQLFTWVLGGRVEK